MSPDQWSVAWRLFHAAIEVPAAQRRSLLESASDDQAVIGQVLHLLEDTDEDDSPRALTRSYTEVSHYRVGERIGGGGMGEVYSAHDTKLDRTVALKFVSAHDLGTQSVKRLIREARAASALNHPNIVTVHEVIESESELAIVMELVDGAPLRTTTGRSLPLPKLVSIGRQIAEALVAAHARGIVHRDIKPANIMVRDDGYVKLLDFGLARRLDAAQSTQTAAASGTLQYMSPEQARGEKATAPSDIFSFGIVLYELATGRHPFGGESPFETAHAILTKEPPRPSVIEPGVAPELETLLLAMLNKDAQLRPAVTTVLRQLNSFTELKPGAPVFRRRSRAALLRYWKWIAASCLLAAAVPFGLPFFAMRTQPTATILSPVPLTTDAGYEYEPRLSPDAGRVAYTRGTAAHPEVVVQVIGSAAPPVVIARDCFSPAWSPRGDSLAVLQLRGEAIARKDVLMVSPSGGVPRKIAEIDTPGALQDWVPSPYLDFSGDGRYLVALDGWGGSTPAGLVLISAETGDKVPLTTPGPGAYGDFSPRFSPDGNRVVFSRMRGFGASDLRVLKLTSDMRPAGVPEVLASNQLWNAFPAWTPDGQRLIFASGTMRNARLKMVRAVAGHQPVDLPVADFGICPLDVRGDPKSGAVRLIYARKLRNDDIYRVPLAGKERLNRNRRPIPLIDSSFVDEFPLYSPDGNRIAFISNRSGSLQLWVCRADGKEPRQLTNLQSADINNLAWSPDSSRIAARLAFPRMAGIFEVDVSGGAVRPLIEEDATGPSFSPDGRWLYFQRRNSTSPAWRMPARGGTPEPAPDTKAAIQRFTPDGKTLVWAQGLQLFVMPAAWGPTTRVFDTILSGESWAVTQSGVYAVTRSSPGGPWQVAIWRFADRRAAPVVEFDRTPGNGLSISPDERYALITQREHIAIDLMLLDRIDLTRFANF
jgi:eukaryotic-like serine/threonine-protein kinase